MNYYNAETLLDQEKEIYTLKQQNAALSAQVEAIKIAIDNIRNNGKSSGFGTQSPDSVRKERLAWLQLNEVMAATPTQCLLEVKAEAGRAGFMYCAEKYGNMLYSTAELVAASEKYANKARAGE